MTNREMAKWYEEMAAWDDKQIAHYSDEIEHLNREIQRERKEDREMVAHVWSRGVLTRWEMATYGDPAKYCGAELWRLLMERNKAYRERNKYRREAEKDRAQAERYRNRIF